MKNIFIPIIAVFFLSFSSCRIGDWNLTLYEQKIEGTSKALYKYDAWGGRDTHLSGYTILDTTQKFDINRRNKLPINLLTEIPHKNLIQGVNKLPYEKDKPESQEPIRTDQQKSEEILVKTDYYQGKGYSKTGGVYQELEFERFKETRDSIFFYDLNEFTHMNTGHLDSLKIKKGNIYLSQKKNSDSLHRIYVDNLIISNDGKKTLISKMNYNLKPKHLVRISEFSDYGIFKPKNTMPNNAYN